MSKAHSIIKLLTFGALGTAAYLQAGSDPESANRLTIMLTSLLGTLSGEVGGGILDRALFDKEAPPHASAVANVVENVVSIRSQLYESSRRVCLL